MSELCQEDWTLRGETFRVTLKPLSEPGIRLGWGEQIRFVGEKQTVPILNAIKLTLPPQQKAQIKQTKILNPLGFF